MKNLEIKTMEEKKINDYISNKNVVVTVSPKKIKKENDISEKEPDYRLLKALGIIVGLWLLNK
jgi:hypothetical protein